MVKEWSSDFDFHKEILRKLPIWVKFHGLPANCWSTNSLSRINSLIGSPKYTYNCTTRLKRIAYARVLIEVDVTQHLLKEVNMEIGDNRIRQGVEYEWLPTVCRKCNVVGA